MRNKVGISAPPVRRSQTERRALSTERLISTAITLFAQRGYSNTSLADIGESAGYSRGIVRERFGSKEALIEPVLESITTTLNNFIAPALEGKSGIDRILSYGESYLVAVESSREEMYAVYQLRMESITLVPQVRHVFQQIDEDLREVVSVGMSEGIASGDIDPDLDPGATATLLVSMLRGIVMQKLMDPDKIVITKLLPLVRELIIRMLMKDGAAAGSVDTERGAFGTEG